MWLLTLQDKGTFHAVHHICQVPTVKSLLRNEIRQSSNENNLFTLIFLKGFSIHDPMNVSVANNNPSLIILTLSQNNGNFGSFQKPDLITNFDLTGYQSHVALFCRDKCTRNGCFDALNEGWRNTLVEIATVN